MRTESWEENMLNGCWQGRSLVNVFYKKDQGLFIMVTEGRGL